MMLVLCCESGAAGHTGTACGGHDEREGSPCFSDMSCDRFIRLAMTDQKPQLS